MPLKHLHLFIRAVTANSSPLDVVKEVWLDDYGTNLPTAGGER